MKLNYIILILIYSSVLNAQIDSFTGSINTSSDSDVLMEIEVFEESYFFSTTNFEGNSGANSVYKTDKNFNILNKLEDLQIHGEATSYNSLLKKVGNKLLMVSNVEIDSKKFIFTHSLTLDLTKHTIIDSVLIVNNTHFDSYTYKINSNGNLFSFGNTYTNGGAINRSANYIEINPEGKILKYEILEGTDDVVITFDYEPTNSIFYVSGLVTASYLVDTSFTVIDTFYNEIEVSTPLYDLIFGLSSHCWFLDTANIQCISSGPSTGEYSNISAIYSLIDNKLSYKEATPLHPIDSNSGPVTLITVTQDSDLNFYFAYHERFSTQDNIASPNKIFISKFDKDLNHLYNLELLNDEEYIISSSKIDNENNLIIVGGSFTPDSPDLLQNFYIKLSEDGSVLTNTSSFYQSEKLILYPNPCSDVINIDMVSISTQSKYSVFSLDGRLMSQGQFNTNTINISNLHAGMYILQIVDDKIIYSEKFVKE